MRAAITADASAVLKDLRDRAAVEVPLNASYLAGAAYLKAMGERYERFSRGGGDWAPLTESTKRGKAAKGYDPDAINIGDGRLLDSLRPGAPENILDLRPDGADCGSSVPYAPFVQAQRPILVDPDPQTEAEILRAIADGMK